MKNLILALLCLLLSGCITVPMTKEDREQFEREWRRQREREQFEPYIPSPHDFKGDLK